MGSTLGENILPDSDSDTDRIDMNIRQFVKSGQETLKKYNVRECLIMSEILDIKDVKLIITIFSSSVTMKPYNFIIRI